MNELAGGPTARAQACLWSLIPVQLVPTLAEFAYTAQFVHGYNGERGTLMRSAAETALKRVPTSPIERSEPDELGYATVGRKVASSSSGSYLAPSGHSSLDSKMGNADLNFGLPMQAYLP